MFGGSNFTKISVSNGKSTNRSFGLLRNYSTHSLTEPFPNVPSPSGQPLPPPQTNISVLPNGVVVASVYSHDHSSSIGVFVGSGSRHETKENRGTTFLLRSLGYKSTAKRTQLRLVREFEALGANYNVTSGREQVLFSADGPTDKVPQIAELLSDVFRPKLAPHEIEEAKEVSELLKEELTSDACARVLDLLHQEAYRGKTLGNSLYPTHNLANLTKKHLSDWTSTNLRGGNLLVVGIGGITHESLTQLATRHFGSFPTGAQQLTAEAKYIGGYATRDEPISTHLGIAFEGASFDHNDSVALSALQYILGQGQRRYKHVGVGSGKASRLNRNVLEKNSWVDEVSTFNLSYKDSGLFGLFAVAQPGNAAKLASSLAQEIKGVLSGVSSQEVARAKSQLKASVLFKGDSRHSLLEFIGSRFSNGKVTTPSDAIKAVDSLTETDIHRVAKKVFSSKPTVVAIGDVEDLPTTEDIHRTIQ